MREDYLHYLFKNRILGNQFQTTSGKSLTVNQFGEHNENAGPDFLQAIIDFDGKQWAGSIEFHVKSSDWYLHKHQHDSRYTNVIAHFVYEHDREVTIEAQTLPTIELKSKVNLNHYEKYLRLANSAKAIACASQLKEVKPIIWTQQKERALVNRLMRKSKIILGDLKALNGDLEKTFFLSLARTLGGKVNAVAFEELMLKTDLGIIKKSMNPHLTAAALLFGLSGLLEIGSEDEYVILLQEEFRLLRCKHGLHSMNAKSFRFSRMHPGGFPTVRIAQLAAIVASQPNLGSLLKNPLDLHEIQHQFCVELPAFWKHHYRFEKSTVNGVSTISDQLLNQIVINTFAPTLFALGNYLQDSDLKDYSLKLLEQAPAEQNSILTHWQRFQVLAINAFDSQALIEQKNEFCSQKKCLSCSVGSSILKS